ncbi:phage portal protein [Polynucleobacter yangtzensis]|nr:phage portal protein [Polynucleobacter yangtzensis]
MIRNLINRFWAGGSSYNSDLPYFGSEMLNRSGFVAKQNPEGLASVQRSVQILSDACCSTSIGLMRKLPTGGKEVVDSPIAKALNRLNFRSLDLAITSALFSGNGFLKVTKEGEKISFLPISSHRVSIAIDASGNHWYQVAADKSLAQSEMILSASEMVHIRPRVDRTNPLLGISPLSQIHASLPAICDAHFLMGALSKNLATPGLILATDASLNKDQVTRLREIADQQAAGYKTGGTLILSSGLTPVSSQVTQSIKDADLVNALAFSTIEVSRVFGIPTTLLGDTASTSFATASELHRSFQRSTVKPLQARIADAFTEALLTDEEIDSGLTIEFDSADFGAGIELAETLSTLANSGIFTTNEIRNILGRSDATGGEVLRAPMNTAPIADWANYYKAPKTQTGKTK